MAAPTISPDTGRTRGIRQALGPRARTSLAGMAAFIAALHIIGWVVAAHAARSAPPAARPPG